jgi:two-component system, LytTR family, sensor kinase
MKAEGKSLKSNSVKSGQKHPLFMHPVIFVGLFSLLGELFALQQWTSMRLWSYHVKISQVMAAWGLQYFLWGLICWFLWRWFGPQIQKASLAAILTRMLPLSVFLSVFEEVIWVFFFPSFPIGSSHWNYWRRFGFELNGDFFDNLVVFWCAFGLFRGLGYYEQFRQKESIATRLEIQLANAQISALRMQLNPHFLFNTMNSISSLMRSDVEAADNMLEQLSSLLRITLERGNSQFVPLRDEIDFIEVYLALQEQRYRDRVHKALDIDPSVHDALVPAMILQPIVENAYAHGISKLDRGGILEIRALREGTNLRLSVLNSGIGLGTPSLPKMGGHGVGLTNIRSRLELHYGAHHTLLIHEVDQTRVEVVITFPLQLSQSAMGQIARFGA